MLNPGNSDQLQENNNILSLTPSQQSVTEAAMALVDTDSDVKMIYYYDSSDIYPYLDYLNNNGNYGQISFQQVRNISIQGTEYMKTKKGSYCRLRAALLTYRGSVFRIA